MKNAVVAEKTVLVIGGLGFIGSYLVSTLRARGVIVHVATATHNISPLSESVGVVA